MAWGMLIAAGYSAYNQYQAGEAGEDRAEFNAQSLYEESTETIRRAKLAQKQTLSSTKAKSGASGISMKSSTVMTYLDEMKSNFKKEIDWMENARTRGVRIERQRGSDTKRQATATAFGTLARGVGSAVDK